KRPLTRCFASPAGARSLVSVSFTLSWPVGTMLVHGSQASPRPSPSASACDGFGMESQLSSASHTVSPSVSGCPVSAGQLALVPVQLSGRAQLLAAGRQTGEEGADASAGHALAPPSPPSAASQTPA